MKRRVLSGAAMLVASAALTLGLASTASAETTTTDTTAVHVGTGANATPMSSSGCNLNICIGISNVDANNNVTIQGWAYRTSFYGYIRFTGPQGLNKHAGPKTWIGGHGNYAYIGAPAIVGKYCVHGYFPDGTNQGTACNNVG
jgi:hypothetical protein